jgi:hypothetical protein
MATTTLTQSLFKLLVWQSFIVIIIHFPKFSFRTFRVWHCRCTSTRHYIQQAHAWETASLIMAPSMKTQIIHSQQHKQQRRQRSKVTMKFSSTMSTSPSKNARKSLLTTPMKEMAYTTNDVNKSNEWKVLLQQWMEHAHADYHNFTPQEAVEIRSAVLHWYINHRRKLPWRGDPPPFDGSTSGRNYNKATRNNKKMKAGAIDENSTQPSIQSFFYTKETTQSITIPVQLDNNSSRLEDKEDSTTKDKVNPIFVEDAIPIPVTGYGVWVSEIMLQQTRVEAVIPYWIRCEFWN